MYEIFIVKFSARAYRAASLALGTTGHQEERSLLDILMQSEDNKNKPQPTPQISSTHNDANKFQSAFFLPNTNSSKVCKHLNCQNNLDNYIQGWRQGVTRGANA